ncbi:hypothetical protein [Paraburkholderia tropica]|uniref:hypothetical protein n=1 Tax=Paraburkholderia tropica TaxID=92647 RepID=UPI000F546891|nr:MULTISPECIES: hypothetical protein [Paraburkholderia]MBB2999456.1 hypothetical protein [Paraburkholderia tropica]MBB6317912.1 hypothetical protein [Paraburkholderia tropica]QNB11318.1 hypothetical protein G5S35_06850 [Paraburkholderia tropica]RQM45415.1 hypothetical protein EHZ19_24105 [Paraburkholderia bannensis]
MNKPSERIVVFVTPAQKRAISATADELGISISELMRRAVIAFSATSDQVKAASIVDRLNAPRQPDALAQVLRKAAKPLKPGRAGIRPAVADEANAPLEAATPLEHAQTSDETHEDHEARLEHDATHEVAQAVARLAASAAESAAQESHAALPQDVHFADNEPLQPLSGTPFARRTLDDRDEEDTHRHGPAPEGGKFA